jgi:sulfur carrier protein ThiS
MRMHRGSSKDARGLPPATGTLPLSASPARHRVEVEVARGGRTRAFTLDVVSGTLVRAVVRAAGESPEGCAVLIGETPVPLDTPVDRPVRLTVVPTFSGG